MKKLLLTAALALLSVGLYGQIDSVEVYTPSNKKVEVIKPDTKKTFQGMLDSLNKVYKTNEFDILIYRENGEVIRKTFYKKVVKDETI